MSDRAEEQRRLILDQFTKQAIPFAEMCQATLEMSAFWRH